MTTGLWAGGTETMNSMVALATTEFSVAMVMTFSTAVLEMMLWPGTPVMTFCTAEMGEMIYPAVRVMTC